ncbi:unnamed protein product [Linum trigynum]|uniref:DUF1618 domain-containing protein n=1 Tax=Linum trigynum TaxID=586398 RepID=A0AAV2DNQ1_9ROSI
MEHASDSDSAVASPERKKPRRRWWDSGIVSGSLNKVTIFLMGRKNKTAAYDHNDTDPAGIRTATVTVAPSCDFRGIIAQMGLALVDSKLYAFGGNDFNTSPNGIDDTDDDGFPYWKYPRDLYVCDLGTDPDIQKQPLEFKQYADRLKGPKVRPIHVPYKDDKIFILSSAYHPLSFRGPHPDLSAPCEVLNLKDLSTQVVDLPLEMWDPRLIPSCSLLPGYMGHIVVGRELIVYMHNHVGERVFALDMEELKWRRIITECDDDYYETPMIPNLLLMIYPWVRFPEAYCSNLVHNGRLFMVERHGHHRPFDVILVKFMSNASASYADLLQQEHKTRKSCALSELASRLPADCLYGDAMVVPFGDGDVYCLFLWWGLDPFKMKNQFKVYKFKLVDDNGGCEILGAVEDFGVFAHDFGSSKITVFTRTSYIETGVW